MVFYKKFEVPDAQNCPDCRLIRRFLERNAKHLYYRTCDATGKKTLSQYHADQPFPVYSPEAWWGDSWEALNFGRDFDFSRGFFEQFRELKYVTPHCALFNTESTNANSTYTNCTAYLKNCYLVAETDHCEDCYYGNLLKKCLSCVDCSICYDDEVCYECVDCNNCYNLRYSQDCQNCKDSFFLKNCIGCENCIGCMNQRHKKYMIFNKECSREEYEKSRAAFALDTQKGVDSLRARSCEFFKTQPHKYAIAEQNQNSVGDHLYNSKNSYFCFDSKGLEDCRYCAKLSLGVKSSMDYNSWGNQSELMYECCGCGDHCYGLKFCAMCQSDVKNCEYSYELFSCADCFGCVALKRKKYCILNKQYSSGDYKTLRAKIIKHMKAHGEYGEFFPINIGAFAYNESIAMDTFPLTREEALKKGFKWRDEILQENAAQADALQCLCGKYYRLIPQELKFYEQYEVPLPSKCAACRHRSRMELRNPLQLWMRDCSKCGNGIQTSYAPYKPEIVYCEKCYLKTVY